MVNTRIIIELGLKYPRKNKMTGHLSRKVLTVALTLSVCSNTFAFSTPVLPKDSDYLHLLDSIQNYSATSDVKKVSKVDSSFYTKDEKTMADLQKRSEEEFKNYMKNSDAKQASANPVLIKSLNDAYDVSKKKLEIQKAAAEAFGQALKEAQKLDAAEKSKEESCLKDFNLALAKGNEVSKTCNDQEDEDDKNACADELKACEAKINADLDKFNEYIKERFKKQPSMTAFKIVNEIADELTEELDSTKQVCSRFSSSMGQAENAGSCRLKIDSDGLDESYQGAPPKSAADAINVDLDSSMFVPKHRIAVWTIFKKMADDKVAETTAEMKKIKEYIEKLGGKVLDLEDGTTIDKSLNADDQTVGVRSNNGTIVTVGLIKRFFATNPSPEAILKEAAALGLTKDQIAHAMNIAGYGGEKPSDLNNYAQTRAQEEKYKAKIDEFVASKGGNFNGPEGAIQVPGYSQVDATKNVMSNKGWVTPEMVSNFLKTNPTDQQFFEKMAELGLRSSDIGTILNGQGLLFKDGDPRQVLSNDSTYGSIHNRLQLELYQGITGYGVSDTYDPNAYIVKGTGHIMDEENKVWIPYGFKSSSSQRVNTNNQASAPPSFVSGGQFGVNKAVRSLKVIKPDELKKLRTK